MQLNSITNSGDPADMAQDFSELDLKIALNRRKIDAKKMELPVTGFCLYCDAILDNDYSHFCPTDEDGFSCAKEYEKEQEAKKRNGGK